MDLPKKNLGQHWLTDQQTLHAIVTAAEVLPTDTVLEVGPGLGTLTKYLAAQAASVIAVELDEALAADLPSRVKAANLSVANTDILKFDLTELTPGYKVVANIPYYLTSNLLRTLSESVNPPKLMVLLVQQEVAERICAEAGQMSLLSVSVQLYYRCELGIKVPAEKFDPPPKVDSQVVILHRHPTPLLGALDAEKFFRVVKAGFSERRKKLRSSLSGGLNISKEEADKLLARAEIDGDLRAQNLNLKDWYKIYETYN